MPHLPEPPFVDPVLVFAVATAVFLLLPRLFERARIPGLIGLIVAGAAIGPNGFGLLERDATIVLLGTVGLLYLMFLVGLELDLDEFAAHRRTSVTFGLLSYALPQAVGTGLSLLLGYELPAAVLLGTMFASHTLVAYPILGRLRIVRTGAATTVLGATLLTDMLALLTLAVVTGERGGGAGPDLWLRLGGSLALYIGAVLWTVPRLGRWYFRRSGADAVSEYVFVLAVLFGFAALADLVGLEPIIGALLVGFAMNRLVPAQGPLMNRIRFGAEALFIPFFLLSVGMLVDVRAFGHREAWLAIGALVVGTVSSKAIAAKLTERLFGFAAEDGWLMFGLSVSHAAATMAITMVGYQAGLFDGRVVNAIVVVILVTCLLGPWVVQRSGRRVALREAQRPYDPSAAPQRILIPLANPATSDALLDLAIALREPDSPEPLHPLMVVPQPVGDEPDAGVARAELLLGHAVTRAVEAEVPVVPLTRIDRNVAVGITRASSEARASLILLGWDGGHTGAGQWIFGSVLDQVLDAVSRQVIVARLSRPLGTIRRVLVILPPAIEFHPGAYDALGCLKRLASQAGAALVAAAVGGDPGARTKPLAELRPRSLHVEPRGVDGWEALPGFLRHEPRPDDLVVVLSARRGTIAWNPKLERLPGRLPRLDIANFLIVYPSQSVEREISRPTLPAALSTERILRIDGISFGTAIARLARLVAPDRGTSRRLRRKLIASELEFSNEILPGVLLPHARLAGLEEATVAMGISADGLLVPGASAPVRLIVLLVSPLDRPEVHLRHLADVARFLKSPERVAEVLQDHAPELSTDWLTSSDPRPEPRPDGQLLPPML